MKNDKKAAFFAALVFNNYAKDKSELITKR